MIITYVTCANEKEAKKIGKSLLEAGRAKCVNILPKIESIYLDDDKIVEEKEVVLICKSRGYLGAEGLNVIKENHSYETPAIISWQAVANREFTDWISE